MRKRIVIGLALGVGVLSLAGFACGWRHHRHDPARMAQLVTERVDDALDDVNATSEQREKIHAVKDRMLARAQALHGDHAATRAVILEAWKADAPDAAKLHALVDERANAMRALAHEAVDAGIEVHGVLTPEQRAKLAEKLERRGHW